MGLVERRTIYGRNDFEKDRRGITYHTERATSCGTYDIETVVQGIKVVSAPACTGRKSGTIPGRCVCR